MLKLKRYVIPYIALLLIAVVLLFGQAMLNLELPNVMSDIVNNGIQKGGITESAPHAISNTGLQLMRVFMTEEDRQLTESGYTQVAADANRDADVKAYPAITDEDYVLTATSSEDIAALDNAFAKASYAFVLMAQDSGLGTEQAVEEESASASFDMDALETALPMLQQLPPEAIQDYITRAGATAQTTTSQTAAVFVKAFYQQVGADTDAMQTNYILWTGMKMLGLCVLILLCAVGAGYCLSRMGAGVGHDLRRDVFSRVTHFSSAEMDKFSTASLITRTTNDITQVQTFLTMGLRMLCFAPIMGIGGLIMALRKCVNMAWIIGLAILFMICLIITLFIVAMPKFKKMQDLLDRLNLVSRENLSGMMVIRAFATQDFEEKRFDRANKDLSDNTLFVNRSMATMMPLISFLMSGITLLIVWVGAKQIADSNLQVGDMMAFMQYAMHVVMSFLFISMMFIMVPRASVSAERINEILETEYSVTDPATPKDLTDGNATIQFNNVSFRYTGADEDVLHDINFTARPGETTAFIGSTGSGKSTLINLIPRFYDVTQGSITVNGVDIREVSQHELREKIGYVPQKGMLFAGTVESNLTYGDENADEQTVHTAAEVAQAADFIAQLDDGYDTAISQGGTNVSGGQRQRLSIARALVKKAPIYIFDDTFSALDFKTDANLRKALEGYTDNATVLIVAQRVSTIMHAQQIVVLDEGSVVGIGTHEELLQTCSQYREIAQSQLTKEELA